MRSKLTFKGHPLHTLLVPFPLAFLVGCVVFDWLAFGYNNPGFASAGGYMSFAGIAMALVAAVPGLVDLVRTVPPRSSARKRGTLHMSVNLLAVLMFGLAAWWRVSPAYMPTLGVLVIQTFALILLSTGGWLGGTLVVRNQIGVDHRYANAGKWKEEYFEPQPGKPVTVATLDELQVGQMKLLHMDGSRVVLARTAEGYCAFEDHCPHRGGSLADGALVNGTVQCPWHGSQFDVRTGTCQAGPAHDAIRVFKVDERERIVMLTMPEVEHVRA